MKKTFTLIIGIIFSIIVLNGQEAPPQAFSFKASINGSNGQPLVNRTINLLISILQDNEDGLTLYSEEFSPTTNSFGLVDIEIGKGTPLIGDFSLIDWSADEYFLKVEVDAKQKSEYVVMSITQLLSVPYALHAGNGFIPEYSEFDNRPVLDENGNIGLGTEPGPVARLRVNGVLNIMPGNQPWGSGLFLNAQDVSGGGGINYILASLGNNAVEGPGKFLIRNNDWKATFIMDQDGNVGIGLGQGSPNYKLDVAGDINFTGDLLKNGSPFAGDYNALENKPDLSIYAKLAGDQTFTANNVFSNDIQINGLTVGRGNSGIGNTAFGDHALNSTGEGGYNTAIGDYALSSNTTGEGNTAIGYTALYSNTTTRGNTAIGSSALYSNTTGNGNTANGSGALRSNTTGAANTALGGWALNSNTTGNSNTAIGFTALYYNTTGRGNIAIGEVALYVNTTGKLNTVIGTGAGQRNTTGDYNTFVGYDADAVSGDLTNTIAIGYKARVNASNKIVLGNADATTVGGYGDWTNYSDIRLKENIAYNNNLGLNFITMLKPVSFNYSDDTNKRRRDGLIAQDVEQILKELGLEFSGLIIDDDAEKTMNLSYPAFVIPLITAVQEQQKQIENQQNQINELKELIQKLTSP